MTHRAGSTPAESAQFIDVAAGEHAAIWRRGENSSGATGRRQEGLAQRGRPSGTVLVLAT